MSSVIFVVVAYVVLALIMIGYALLLARRQAALRGEVEEVERLVQQRRSPGGGG